MSLHSWLQNFRSALAPSWIEHKRCPQRPHRTPTHRLKFEVLEDRCLLAFIAPVDYAVGSHPLDVTTGDFNGDAVLDLATANADDNTVSVLLGNTDGTFRQAQTSATGPSPMSVAVGDFNADRKLDLATANNDSYGGGDNDVSILLGHGDGTFAAALPESIGVPAYSWYVTSGDLDADGRLDLVVTSDDGWLDGYVSVLLGQGDGNFAPAAAYGPYYGQLSSPALADVNRDGSTDVAVADSFDSVKILLGNGDGTLQQPTDFGIDTGPDSVTLGDFNADGIVDLATTNYSSGVSVLLGNSDGTFQTAHSFVAGAHPLSASAGDVNGDDILDLVVTDQGSAPSYVGAVSVLLGSGDGSFALSVTTGAGPYPNSVVVADFNADGRPDAATANAGSSTVSVLLNDGTWRLPDLPRISISDVARYEARKNKTTLFTFTVTLSAAYDQPVTMSYRTVDGTATTSNSDYVAKTGTLTFAPGETTKTITIVVKGDHNKEADETFYLDLFGNSDNSLFTKSRGLGTILNDD